MFKKSFSNPNSSRPRFFAQCRGRGRFALWLLLVVGIVGCRTIAPLPAVNLSEPGWKTQRGQAVWKPKKDAPEIAGELLVASNSDGRAFVQFTKTPFPIAIAQTTHESWQIEFGAVNKRFSGRGNPPQRIIWLQLSRFVGDDVRRLTTPGRTETRNEKLESPHPPSRRFGAASVVSYKTRQWSWQSLKNNRWLLCNRITGESLEGFLAP